MAEAMREIFPPATNFFRGREATLLAVAPGLSDENYRDCVAALREKITAQQTVDFSVSFQSAYAIADGEHLSLYDAAHEALHALRSRKLMDRKSAHSEVVTSLLRALQECDNDTEAHVRRTQELGARLGRRLGLTEDQRSNLDLLCILHDIGKVGIPLEILNKPGMLTDAEWEMLKTHTTKGYEIAMASQELRCIADMVLHHHERWDGKGYPDRLSKEAIPLLSRIISVVDSYDAMISDRPYRAGMTKEQAQAELRRCAGTQFDPGIVAEMVDMLEADTDDGLQVSETHFRSVSDLLTESGSRPNEEIGYAHQVRYARYLLDDSGSRIAQIDENFTQITGYTMEDVQRLSLRQIDLLPEEDRANYLTVLQHALASSTTAFIEHRLLCKNGQIIFVFCLGRVYYDSSVRANRSEVCIADTAQCSSVRTLLGVERDLARTSLERWEKKYRCDSLTGLLSHEAFRSDVQEWLLQEDTNVMLLMMDIDHFKEYNDTHGHRSGDEFLIMVANALREAAGENGLACRMGGDEFAVALRYPGAAS